MTILFLNKNDAEKSIGPSNLFVDLLYKETFKMIHSKLFGT